MTQIRQTGARVDADSLAHSIERQFRVRGFSARVLPLPAAELLRGEKTQANAVARLILATARSVSPPTATTCIDLQGFSMGGTGLEPVTPSLSIWCRRSRQFAGVRSSRVVERNPSSDRTVERTRANANPCHSCHARRHPQAASISSLYWSISALDPVMHLGREHASPQLWSVACAVSARSAVAAQLPRSLSASSEREPGSAA